MSPDLRSRLRSRTWSSWASPLSLTLVGIVVFLLLAGIVGQLGDDASPASAAAPTESLEARSSVDPSHPAEVPQPAVPTGPPSYVVPAAPAIAPKPQLPGGGYRIFGDHRFLVAYYGTAQTGAMGVLGATDPETMQRRLVRAARPFREPGEHIQPVYELIVTVADRSPGPDRDYSHDIPRSLVEQYLQVAHRNGALLLLDIQTGRSPFPVVAKRWTWALRKPWVGLALDPEWRMGPHQVPASVVGSVRAAEVNRTSLWLSRLVRREGLPEKLFVLHQFRLTMLPDIARIVHRPGLAMVQHADGFGTRDQKLATYHAITRPRQFRQGFKLFYHWDVHRFTPAQVRRIRPAVSFVSYQ
ncbi:MAG TPA: hypothetical protein VGK78_15790 [Nocardioides sp.]|uniref:hypothetical protein n=1 Tax=Nocardioides sp. TaxID=35761 RepID=UPI002F40CC16